MICIFCFTIMLVYRCGLCAYSVNENLVIHVLTFFYNDFYYCMFNRFFKRHFKITCECIKIQMWQCKNKHHRAIKSYCFVFVINKIHVVGYDNQFIKYACI